MRCEKLLAVQENSQKNLLVRRSPILCWRRAPGTGRFLLVPARIRNSCIFMDTCFEYICAHKVGVKPIRSYSDKMLAEEVKKAIIVVKGGITPFARSAIMELCAQREVTPSTLSVRSTFYRDFRLVFRQLPRKGCVEYCRATWCCSGGRERCSASLCAPPFPQHDRHEVMRTSRG